jgi:hypothetical protein
MITNVYKTMENIKFGELISGKILKFYKDYKGGILQEIIKNSIMLRNM